MEILQQEIEKLVNQTNTQTEFRQELSSLDSIFPFSDFEYSIAHLIASKQLEWDEYLKIRDNYLVRNRFLYTFDLSISEFRNWATNFLTLNAPNLGVAKSTMRRRNYDYLLSSEIKILYRVAKVMANEGSANLYKKAVSSKTEMEFNLSFRDIYTQVCDVVALLVVWTDKVDFYLLPASEAKNYLGYAEKSQQQQLGSGQFFITNKSIHKFDKFISPLDKIEENICKAFEREKNLRNIEPE